MVVRKRRKVNKLRGHRTMGGGDTKNRRGSGTRGGVGRGGSRKHKRSKFYKDFGVKKRLKPKAKAASMNLDDLQEMLPAWVAAGKAEKKGAGYAVDGKKVGIGKVLGRGTVTEKLALANLAVSGSAREKILAAGGSVAGEESLEDEALGGGEGEEGSADGADEPLEDEEVEESGSPTHTLTDFKHSGKAVDKQRRGSPRGNLGSPRKGGDA